MQLLFVLWTFYKKMLLPSLALSLLLGFLNDSGTFSFQSVGMAFMMLLPFFHFVVYEIRNANEYYFYYNLGYSKLSLWSYTVGLSVMVGLTLFFI